MAVLVLGGCGDSLAVHLEDAGRVEHCTGCKENARVYVEQQKRLGDSSLAGALFVPSSIAKQAIATDSHKHATTMLMIIPGLQFQ